MAGDIGEQGSCTTCAYTEGTTCVPHSSLFTIADILRRLFELLDRGDVLQTPKRLIQTRSNLSKRSARYSDDIAYTGAH